MTLSTEQFAIEASDKIDALYPNESWLTYAKQTIDHLNEEGKMECKGGMHMSVYPDEEKGVTVGVGAYRHGEKSKKGYSMLVGLRDEVEHFLSKMLENFRPTPKQRAAIRRKRRKAARS